MTVYLAHSAKDGIAEQTYKLHVSEVLRMAREKGEKVAAFSPFGSLLLVVVEYAAAFHDIGKLDDENQRVLRTGKGSLPVKHWDAGTAHLLSYEKRLANQIAAFIVACHHRGLLSVHNERVKGPGMFREPSAKDKTDIRLSEYLAVHMSEVGDKNFSECDWKGNAATPLFMRMALSCLVDADHTDTARNYGNAVPEGEVPIEAGRRLAVLDKYVEGLPDDKEDKRKRNVLRRKVYIACRTAQPADNGLIACDSPVGTGKTTAIMAHLLNVAAQKNLRRVFVVLPFTNIIDQSVDVYRKALLLDNEEAEKVVAAHHHKAEFEEEEARAFSFLWNAPITVTTAVQFFETIASNHPATLRKLHQLAGSAIFIDEAHAALPTHLWPQAWKWLQELVRDWGCYIVMASGSLTRFWTLEEFSAPTFKLPELVKLDVRELAMDAEKERIVYQLKDEPLSLENLCNWISDLPGPGLVILNTVQSAAAVAREMAKRHGRDKVEHLSTALAPIHRNVTIDRVKKRLKDTSDTDWKLIATSCVEAGMDFSFRSAARELCSLVSTIQTSGRTNRSDEFEVAELWLFKITGGDLLKEHPTFKTSSRILTDLYREQKISPEFCKEAMRREVRDLNQGLCENDVIVKAEKARNFPEVEEKFKIIASNTISVVVDNELKLRLEDRKDRKGVTPQELQQKTVAIYSSKALQYGVMPLQGAGDLYAWMLEYDDFLGYMAGVLKLATFADNCCI